MMLKLNLHTKDSVQRYLEGGKYPSLLLFGAAHLGKSLCARQMIKKILGVDESSGLLSHPDFLEVRDKSVESVRELREWAELKPVLFHKKVFLVDDANELSIAAQNALLKILEEEGERVLFIFVYHTDATGSILPTIKSRCAHIRFTGLLLNEPDEVLALLSDGRIGIQYLYKDSSLLNLCRDITELFASERCVSGELLSMLHLLKEKDAEEFFSSHTREEVYLLVNFFEDLFLEALKKYVMDSCSSLLDEATEGILKRYSYEELRSIVAHIEKFKKISHSNKNDFFELIIAMMKE